MGWVIRKQFVLIHQFEPGEGVISRLEIDGRLQQVAVEIAAFELFVFPPPDRESRPRPVIKRSYVFDRSRLSFLAARFERLGMLQAAIAVLRRPARRRRKAQTR